MTRYSRGRRFEHEVRKLLERKGYFCVRSAGSRGVFDLLCVRNGIPWGIQCRLGDVSKREKEKLLETGRKFGIIPCVATKKDGRVTVINLLNGRDIL